MPQIDYSALYIKRHKTPTVCFFFIGRMIWQLNKKFLVYKNTGKGIEKQIRNSESTLMLISLVIGPNVQNTSVSMGRKAIRAQHKNEKHVSQA